MRVKYVYKSEKESLRLSSFPQFPCFRQYRGYEKEVLRRKRAAGSLRRMDLQCYLRAMDLLQQSALRKVYY